MSRVVFLAYYFPPMGGAGTQRTAAFVRHLPSFGIDPLVVCAGERTPGAHTIAHDESLLAGLPGSLPVTRVPAVDQQSPSRRDHCSPARLIASAREVAWARRAADATVFAARRADASAVVVSVSPYVCGHAVAEIRRRTGRPVLLDLRDPWALDGWRSFRTPVQPAVDRRLMRRSLRAADLVIANCPAAAAAFRTLADLPAERVVVIPNGFEAEDFPARRKSVRETRPAHPAGVFRIVHVGTLHDPDPRTARPRGRRRFACGRLARHLRSARTLLLAAAAVRRQHPEWADRLRLEFYGQVHPGHESLARDLGIEDLLQIHPYVDHDQVPGILANADAILVPLHGVRSGEDALVVPGKLYEAVASGRPVLATVPPGDARRLIRLAGGDSRVLAAHDEPGVADAIAGWLEGAAAGWRPEGAPRELLHPFRRDRLTARLAASIDAVVHGTAPPADDPWMELAELTSRLDGGMPLGELRDAAEGLAA